MKTLLEVLRKAKTGKERPTIDNSSESSTFKKFPLPPKLV